MDIAIIGPGAIGSLLAYYLSNAGITPTLICRREVYIKSIERKGGLLVKHGGREVIVNVNPVLKDSVSGSYDYVLVAVKAYDSRSAAEIASSIMSEDGIVVFFQNGMGGVEEALDILEKSKTAVGILTYGALLETPGTVKITGEGEAFIGYFEGGFDEKLEKLCEILKAGGLNITPTSNIQGYRWLKLIVNCSINGLTALLQVKNGALLEVEEFRYCVDRVVEESYLIAKRLKVDLPRNPYDETYKVIRATRENFSSTLQDIRMGRRSEIDFMNGYIVNLGKKLNIRTPYNEIVYYAVKGLERWLRR